MIIAELIAVIIFPNDYRLQKSLLLGFPQQPPLSVKSKYVYSSQHPTLKYFRCILSEMIETKFYTCTNENNLTFRGPCIVIYSYNTTN